MNRRPLVLLALIWVGGMAGAKPWWMRDSPSNETDFLPPDVAFRVGSSIDGNVLRLRWVIADGYYLYGRKIDVQAESPDLVVSAPALPPGIIKTDPYLGLQEIYQQQLEATVAYSRIDGGAHPLQIRVTYQGCAEAGLCYPPITKVLQPGGAATAPAAPAAREASAYHPWEGVAIIGGCAAFLLAGLLLRKRRKLDLPAS